MRRFIQALFGVVVLGGAVLANSVWAPTAEAATTTWDCQAFIFSGTGFDGSVQRISVTNLSSDDREVTVRLREADGDVLEIVELDLNPGEGQIVTRNLANTYRVSVSAGTEKLKVAASDFHYDGSDLAAALDIPCTKR